MFNCCSKIAVKRGVSNQVASGNFNNNNKQTKMVTNINNNIQKNYYSIRINYSTIFFPTCSFTCKKKAFIIKNGVQQTKKEKKAHANKLYKTYKN